jgi:uncharacterized protein (TIGR03435 family)
MLSNGAPARWIWAALLVAIFGCARLTVRGQDAANVGMTKPQMMAKDADPDWEVVAVKRSDPDAMGGGYQMQGHNVEIRRKTVQSMLLFGFGLQRVQLVSAPDWIQTELWNAEGYADAPGEPNHEQMQSLVRKLLTERFGLVVHKEQKEMPVYFLTLAKGGLRMTSTVDDPNGPQSESDREDDGRATMNARNFPTGQLASVLMRVFLDRPVLDKTGLTGHYDLQLKWTQEDIRAPTDGSALPGLFTAIEEQLGLKLEPAKAMADVLVIDKVERPGAN